MKYQKHIVRLLTGSSKAKLPQYIISVLFIVLTAFLSKPLWSTNNYHVVAFILLFVVSILSTFLLTGPVLLASTLAALLWNFFFIPPHYTFHIEKAEDILIFSLFFIIAFINGIMTTRVRNQEKLTREKEKRTNALFQLTKELSKSSGLEEVHRVAIIQIQDHFNVTPFFILQDGNNILHSTGRLQKEKKLDKEDYNVAEWSFVNRKKAGAFINQSFETKYTFYPLLGIRVNPGVVAVIHEEKLTAEQYSLWETYLAQITNALEREFLAELAQKVRFLDESDRLYKTLFNSISHELRIPIATIMGASDSILNTGDEDMHMALCTEIFTASVRLNRLVENLLNMSRLESGRITIRLDWYDINDLLYKVTEELKDELTAFSLNVQIQEDLPLARIDFGLLQQSLYNLIYNATIYTPQGSEICVYVNYEAHNLVIKIEDSGPGFPEEEVKNVFKKFFRVDGSKTGGLGLGLSIVKGFVEAHKGTITLSNKKGEQTGAIFTISIPSEKPDIEL